MNPQSSPFFRIEDIPLPCPEFSFGEKFVPYLSHGAALLHGVEKPGEVFTFPVPNGNRLRRLYVYSFIGSDFHSEDTPHTSSNLDFRVTFKRKGLVTFSLPFKNIPLFNEVWFSGRSTIKLGVMSPNRDLGTFGIDYWPMPNPVILSPKNIIIYTPHGSRLPEYEENGVNTSIRSIEPRFKYLYPLEFTADIDTVAVTVERAAFMNGYRVMTALNTN